MCVCGVRVCVRFRDLTLGVSASMLTVQPDAIRGGVELHPPQRDQALSAPLPTGVIGTTLSVCVPVSVSVCLWNRVLNVHVCASVSVCVRAPVHVRARKRACVCVCVRADASVSG